MHQLGLRELDLNKALRVISDIQNSVTCEVGIAGSLAQRLLSPEIAESLRGKKLNDLDLLLLGTTNSSPERAELRKKCTVLEVIHTSGWYYGMYHKSTGIWVDLFTPPYEQKLPTAFLNNISYTVSSLETQILYLASDILRRAGSKEPIRKKWIKKLSLLSSHQGIDKAQIQKEYSENRDHFSRLYIKGISLPNVADEYIQTALAQKPTLLISEYWYLVKRLFFARKI